MLLGSSVGYAANSTRPLNTSSVNGMVVSTHPLYLIAKAVSQGIEQPVLLLAPGQSGHDIQLRPADRQRLKQASLVLWFGEQYEAPLSRVLKGQPNAIALFDLRVFKRLPLRNAQGQPIANSLDPHIWLEPINAIAIAHAIAAVRARQFPIHAAQYKANANQFGQRLLQATRQQQQSIGLYWAYHDAYQYLERSLNLQFKGSLTIEHDLPPTLSQLAWLQQQRRNYSSGTAVCLLAEGQVEPATLKRLQPVKVRLIDETMLGAQDFVIGWTKLAQAVRQCTKR
ncbi:metal ABC transporter solute-binding protein, Zn/Mn family [Alkanindiges sp. WGS2144]|uniref:metal ABC transporter solute-binding protein, Zn/Mn family n=1 Tax=Alkanindiges sp. WGS2144 TaxID=3366808 RepID=UPI00375156A0